MATQPGGYSFFFASLFSHFSCLFLLSCMFKSCSSYATFPDNLPTVRYQNSLYYLYDSDSAVLLLVYMLEMHAALSLSGFFSMQFGWLCYPAASLLTSGM